MYIRGIRGAIVVKENTSEEIIKETRLLLETLLDENSVNTEDIASIFFSVTGDLNAQFPAVAARKLGLMYTPLFCLNEIPVPGSLEKCVRILMHVNSNTAQCDMRNVYLKGAEVLRPEHGLNTDS